MSVSLPLLTVVIIAADDGMHEREYLEMENNILMQRYNEQVRYIIYKYRSDIGTGEAVSKQLYKNWLGCKYFIEKKEPDASNNGFYKPETLTSFLKNINASQKAERHRYIVLTWGHGAGLGFFTRIDQIKNELLPLGWELLGREHYVKKYTEYIKGASFLYANLGIEYDFDNIADEDLRLLNYDEALSGKRASLADFFKTNTRSGISAKNLASIFKDGLGQVDCLICINCFTQLLETGFFLKESVKVLVASQTTIPFSGIHYEKLFEYLNKCPDAPVEKISLNITSYFHSKYFEHPFVVKGGLDEDVLVGPEKTSLSSANLAGYDKIFNSINRILEFLIANKEQLTFSNQSLTKLVKNARSRCLDTSSFLDVEFIDIKSFFYHIAFYISTETFVQSIGRQEINRIYEELYHSLDQKINQAMLACVTSANLFEFKTVGHAQCSSPRFASLFFPGKSLSIRALQLSNTYFSAASLQGFPIINTMQNLRTAIIE